MDNVQCTRRYEREKKERPVEYRLQLTTSQPVNIMHPSRDIGVIKSVDGERSIMSSLLSAEPSAFSSYLESAKRMRTHRSKKIKLQEYHLVH